MEDTLPINMKDRLYIIGAGEFGRELESWITISDDGKRDWAIAGYIDDGKAIGPLEFPSKYEVVGTVDGFDFKPEDYVLISIANSTIRRKIADKLRAKVRFLTYIDPKATIGLFNSIGEGSIISPNCIVTTNVKIGDHVIINIGAQIGHDAEIGSYSSIMPNVDLGGHCKIGEGVFIGTNSCLIPSRKLARNITVGAGSNVIRNFTKEGISIFGNPAKTLK